jgi:MFS transporter, NNP family, nitrate/nitrite transporter
MPDMETNLEDKNYRWYILVLGALTNTLAVAIPSMCLPVLFSEISRDLDLSLVQVGLIWGIGALPGIMTVLVGGAIGDRFGPKRILTLSCLLAGLAGALRGLSYNFGSLAATVFLFGMVTPSFTLNTLKVCGLWFPRQQLGLASGVLSMGMALGFLVGSLISATFLSPWLGGWRNVLFLYGFASMFLCLPWYFARPDPHPVGFSVDHTSTLSIRQALSRVARIQNVWLLGLAILGINGCIQGTLGYLPLYLRRLGWPAVSADGATAAFHTASLFCVIPIALWSDRLGSRKKMLLGAALSVIFGISLLALVNGTMVWIAVVMSGFVRDGFMAVFMTMIIETDGVGPLYAGTATGMVMIFSGIGSLVAPPLGNSLAGVAPGLPFLFWAALAVVGFIGIALSKERAAGKTLALK